VETKKSPAAWVEEETFGNKRIRFAWSLDSRGNVAFRIGAAPGASRCLPREDLERIQGFMADRSWHPASRYVEKKLGDRAKRSIEDFGRGELGWDTRCAKTVPHLCAIFTRSGLWDWNERRKVMAFRQAERDLAGLRAYYKRRRAGDPCPAVQRGSDVPRRHWGGTLHDLSVTFRTHSRGLRARFEACLGGRHATEKGQRREMALIQFLREHLPTRYGVTRGEVIASTAECSSQADVLIYDALRSPTLLSTETSCLLAAESVYAAIEVKPRLSAGELVRAAANLRSVKALPRTALLRPYAGSVAGSQDWLKPGLQTGGEPVRSPAFRQSSKRRQALRNRSHVIESPPEGPRSNPPVFGAVFAIESDPLGRLYSALEDAQRGLDPELWVDCVCILDQAVIYRPGGRAGHAGWTSEFSDAPPPTRIALAGPDALLYFYLTLLQDINTKTLLPPDLEFYWQPG